MNISSRQALLTVAIVVGISVFTGYKFASREISENVISDGSSFIVDTKKVLSATVESIKSESHLVSYSFVGSQTVLIDRSYLYLFKGRQKLIVPATVSYFVDLAKFNENNVSFDEPTQTVTVLMPELKLRVDFDPTKATMINSGMPMLNDEVVQALTKLNYQTATKSAIKQGQQSEFVRLASERTKVNIERLFRIPLQVAGIDDVKVIVRFPNETFKSLP